ncbi:MAG: hypothetical protein IJG87_00540 [Ruminococcus sp.]|nr:hypothetical protein [Ruminococcus sp.]
MTDFSSTGHDAFLRYGMPDTVIVTVKAGKCPEGLSTPYSTGLSFIPPPSAARLSRSRERKNGKPFETKITGIDFSDDLWYVYIIGTCIYDSRELKE